MRMNNAMISHSPKSGVDAGEVLQHLPAMAQEVLRWLEPRPGSLVVDCTLGGGGHAELLLEKIAPTGRLVGIDRDPASVAHAAARLSRFGDSFCPLRGDYREIRDQLDHLGIGQVDAILADLGVSSLQLLDPQRGFGFAADGPLDMRFDPSSGETAAGLLERLDEKELARLLRRHGEQPQAGAIARAIKRAMERGPVTRTTQLAGIVASAVRWASRPGRSGRSLGRRPRRSRTHPATRTFMALRIAVNDELSGLDRFIEDAATCLRTGGRLCVISFHSLEDRIVKQTFRSQASRCVCPPGLPVCGCGRSNLLRVLTPRSVTPSPAETEGNPRARSARLRTAERL